MQLKQHFWSHQVQLLLITFWSGLEVGIYYVRESREVDCLLYVCQLLYKSFDHLRFQ